MAASDEEEDFSLPCCSQIQVRNPPLASVLFDDSESEDVAEDMFCLLEPRPSKRSHHVQDNGILPILVCQTTQNINIGLSSVETPEVKKNSRSNVVAEENWLRIKEMCSTQMDSPSYGKRMKKCETPLFEAASRLKESLDNTALSEIDGTVNVFSRMASSERMALLEAIVARCSHVEQLRLESLLGPHLKRDFVGLLPEEVSLHILSYLGARDLLTCTRVNRTWGRLAEDWSLWRRLAPPGVSLGVNSKADVLAKLRLRCNWRRGVANRPPLILRAHMDHVITCLEIIGDLVVSASDDSTISVWNAVEGRLERTLTGHVGGVWSTAVVQGLLVSGSTDRCVRVWDVNTGVCLHNLQGHVSTVRCLAARGNYVASGSRDTTVRVWQVFEGDCQHLLSGHRAAVRCVAWFNDSVLVSGSYDATVRVWDVWQEQVLHVLQDHVNRVYTVAATDTMVISGSLDTTIRVWDPISGVRQATLLGHQSLTSGMEVRGQWLVSGNADATIRVWDLANRGRCIHILAGEHRHQSAVTCVQLTDEFIVSASDDGTVKLWDLTTGRFIRDIVRLGSSGGQGGVVWRILVTDSRLVCAAGSRNGVEDTKLVICDFKPSSSLGDKALHDSQCGVNATSIHQLHHHHCATASQQHALVNLAADAPRQVAAAGPPLAPGAPLLLQPADMAVAPIVPLVYHHWRHYHQQQPQAGLAVMPAAVLAAQQLQQQQQINAPLPALPRLD